MPVRFQNAIAKVSVERYFYGKPEESDLDERITNLENKFAPLVAGLREEECGARGAERAHGLVFGQATPAA